MKIAVSVSSVVMAAAACAGPSRNPSHAAAGATSAPRSGTLQLIPSPAAPASPGRGGAEQLFVALESSTGDGFSNAPDTITIAGLDGRARAKAHFKPRSIPFVGTGMSAILPPIAHVAARRAYFIDGDGTVRSLGRCGDVREETRFPVTEALLEASFAVSPDGRRLVGAVVTLPPKTEPAPRELSGLFSMDVMIADAAGAAVVTRHETWTDSRAHGSGAQFVTWDPSGPVASYPAPLGGVGGGTQKWSGPLVHFPGGIPGSPVPISDRCFMNDLLPGGAIRVHPGRRHDRGARRRWQPALAAGAHTG